MEMALNKQIVELDRQLRSTMLTCLAAICDGNAIFGAGAQKSDVMENLRLVRSHLRYAIDILDPTARQALNEMFDDVPL